MATPCAVDSDCIALNADGVGRLRADLLVAATYPGLPAACNGLVCTPAAGVSAPPQKFSSVDESVATTGVLATVAVPCGAPVFTPFAGAAVVNNPSTCWSWNSIAMFDAFLECDMLDATRWQMTVECYKNAVLVAVDIHLSLEATLITGAAPWTFKDQISSSFTQVATVGPGAALTWDIRLAVCSPAYVGGNASASFYAVRALGLNA